jgi:LytS/YehU family sensor histidine kinase
MVPLREELKLLDHYAFIMKLRYGERLVVRISAEPRTLEVSLPMFTFQPLVENAIVHGLEKTTAGTTVEVSCRIESEVLVVEIEDDGAAPDMTTLQEGVGIGNTRARLADIYRKGASLSIAPGRLGGMRFALAIPTVAAL